MKHKPKSSAARASPKAGPKASPKAGPKASPKAGPKASKGPTQRMLRLAEVIRHKLAEMLTRGEIHDDVLASHVISVSEVRLSPDLKLATVYVLPLGGKDVQPVLAAFERAKRYIRGEIAHTIDIKYAPELRFLADDSFETSLKIDRLLASPEVRRDLIKKPDPDPPDSAGS